MPASRAAKPITTRRAALAPLTEDATTDLVGASGGGVPHWGLRPRAASHDASLARVGFAPIVRIDAARREIELCATSEALDSYGTIFDYDASRAAFARWIGNVREMHERRAVGTRVGVRCDDAARKIYVRVRISRGAQDTWEKIQDGTLRGASIGASNVTWQRQTRAAADGERAVNVATAYDLVELSLVDNPANPDALGVSIVRDAVPDIALLDALDIVDPATGAILTQRTFWDDDSATNPAPVEPSDSPNSSPPREAALEASRSESAQADFAANGHPGAGVPHWGLIATAGPLAAGSPLAIGSPADHPPTSRHPASFPERAGKDAGRSPLAIPVAAGSPPLAGEVGSPTGGLLGVRSPHPWTDTRGSFSPNPSPPRPSASPVNSVVDAPRSLGPFSTNAEGYPDVGVPERAEERPTADLGQTPDGNASRRTHAAALAILALCACPLCQTAAALYDAPEAADGEVAARGAASAERSAAMAVHSPAIARALAVGLSANATHIQALDTALRGIGDGFQAAVGQIAGAVGGHEQRLAALEAQPLPGGPVVHASARPIEKTLALAPDTPHNSVSTTDQIRALQSLAGKLSDPQAQIAVAAELIRLQQG